MCRSCSFFFFFFNDTATTEIYTLSLHDALPIYQHGPHRARGRGLPGGGSAGRGAPVGHSPPADATRTPPVSRSEEHTSELQSRLHLVCRLLLEKKKNRLYGRATNVMRRYEVSTD